MAASRAAAFGRAPTWWGYSDFPYLAQAFCIHRHTTDLNGKGLRSECAYGVTSLPTSKATPAQVLDFNRRHWSIENKVHWVRDVTFDEDRSRVRKKSGPHVMASLRNLAMSMLRMAGADNVAEALRFCSWNSRRPLRLIGIAIA
jgi:hypothetical protein